MGIYKKVTIYECSHCWEIFDSKDIVVQGNGELSCKDCYIEMLNDDLEQDDATKELKMKFVKGEISSEKYTEQMGNVNHGRNKMSKV